MEGTKAYERRDGESVLSGLNKVIDPLTRAIRILERVARVDFDWEDHVARSRRWPKSSTRRVRRFGVAARIRSRKS